MVSIAPAPRHRRLSVPLTPADEAELDTIRHSPRRLAALDDVDARASDAQLVHAVFEAGLARIRELETSAEYAAFADDDEWLDIERRRRAARRRVRPDDEFDRQ